MIDTNWEEHYVKRGDSSKPTYPNPYLPPEKLGKENSWEYYFEQPLRIGLEQAYAGENMVSLNKFSS